MSGASPNAFVYITLEDYGKVTSEQMKPLTTVLLFFCFKIIEVKNKIDSF